MIRACGPVRFGVGLSLDGELIAVCVLVFRRDGLCALFCTGSPSVVDRVIEISPLPEKGTLDLRARWPKRVLMPKLILRPWVVRNCYCIFEIVHLYNFLNNSL